MIENQVFEVVVDAETGSIVGLKDKRLSTQYIGDRGFTNVFQLRKDIVMEFGSEPDIAFKRGKDLLVVIEIKGGIDPAGALERYGAATKSFQHSIKTSPHCKKFYLGAVFTPELKNRIGQDRFVEKTFNIIEILHEPKARKHFFTEIFRHALRIVR